MPGCAALVPLLRQTCLAATAASEINDGDACTLMHGGING
jgi:hypothetical protein